MAKLGREVWIGDAAKIRASDARQQKHDKRNARLLLQLLAAALSADLGTVAGTERSAAAIDSSLQTGTNSRAGEERVAAPGNEPRDAAEKRIVERDGTENAARVSVGHGLAGGEKICSR